MKARQNPFRVELLHQISYRFRGGAMGDLVQKFAANDFRGAIVGPHGSGKTTLLLQLINHLQAGGTPVSYLRLGDDSIRFRRQQIREWLTSSSRDTLLALDGAGLINWWQWQKIQKFSQRHAGLIMTCHRSGRLPTLIECQTDLPLLRDLVDQLNASKFVDAQELEKLFQKHQGNIRECFRELYDRWSDKES